jgi:hypothetical protein
LIPLANFVRRRLLRRYLRAYLTEHPLDLDMIQYYEAVRLAGFLYETGYYRQEMRGLAPSTGKPAAFNPPRVAAGVIRRFRAVTGVMATLPDYVA